jgi:hypothetical protein
VATAALDTAVKRWYDCRTNDTASVVTGVQRSASLWWEIEIVARRADHTVEPLGVGQALKKIVRYRARNGVENTNAVITEGGT